METTYVYSIIILSILILYLISSFSFKDGLPTCNNFLINTYLYLAFSICYLGLLIHFIHTYIFNRESDRNELMAKFMPYFILLFISSLVLIYFIATQPTFEKDGTHVIKNHLLWIMFISMMAAIITPRVSLAMEKHINETIYIVSSIFIVMSSIVYMFPKFFTDTYNYMQSALLISLIVIILLEIINAFVSDNVKHFIGNRRILSYIVIILFSVYISYDTKKIIHLSNICIDYPNYPKTSVNFFLDIINLFSRILFLKSGK